MQEWTTESSNVDAVWYNILYHRTMLRHDAPANFSFRMGRPLKVMMSLESEVYYSLSNAYKAGFDYLVDYRIWNDQNETSWADIPAVYMLNPSDSQFFIDYRKPPKLPKRDDALVAAFISNSRAKNNRTIYLQELMQHVPLHSYGKTMHNKDEDEDLKSKSRKGSKIITGSEYFFWFCPENSNAHSYVTEKIYEALEAGSVPIYFGADNVERFIPHPSAYINANDFSSPRDLADHLKRVASDPEEYAKYFEWKKKPFTEDFLRVARLASRSVQCRLAMHLEGLSFEDDLAHLQLYPVE